MGARSFAYKYLLLLAVMLLSVSHCVQARDSMSIIDSLQKELVKQKEDSNKVILLVKISLNYRYVDPTKGRDYAQKAVNIAEQIDWKPGLAKAYSSLANNYQTSSDYLKAIEYYNKAKSIEDELKDKVSLGKTIINIGILYFSQGNYPKALEFFFNALKIEDEINNKEDIAACYMNIGIVYSKQELYDKALEYFFKSLKLAEEQGDKPGIAYNYGNIGLVYKAQKNYAKALEYYEKSLKMNQESGAKTFILADLGNIGNVHRHQQNYQKAFQYFFQSLHIAQELGDKFSMSISFDNIGETYLDVAKDTSGKIIADTFIAASKIANLNKSKEYLEQALAISKMLGDVDGIQEADENLSEVMALLGDYKKALAYHIEFTIYKDSIATGKSKVKIAALETQRALDLKERDLSIEKLKAANKRNERLLYITSIIILLIAMGIVVNKFLKESKSNEQLASEKKRHLARIREQSNVLENIAYTQAHSMRAQVVKILGLSKLFNHENLADPVNRELMEGIASVSEELDIMVKDVIYTENKFNKESKENDGR